MRTKLVPAPPDALGSPDALESPDTSNAPDAFETVVDARRAIPLVPASIEDCCDRLLDRLGDRLGLSARDEAHEWVTFFAALGVVTEAESGYRRPRGGLTREELAIAVRKNVFGAREVRDVLDEADRSGEPTTLDAETVFERVRDTVPTWERHHHADWEREWRGRTRRLLDWLVVTNLAERVAGGYRAG